MLVILFSNYHNIVDLPRDLGLYMMCPKYSNLSLIILLWVWYNLFYSPFVDSINYPWFSHEPSPTPKFKSSVLFLSQYSSASWNSSFHFHKMLKGKPLATSSLGKDVSKYLSFFSKTFITALPKATSVSWLLIPSQLAVYPYRQKLSTRSVSSLLVLRLVVASIIKFDLLYI